MDLSNSSQPVNITLLGVLMVFRWLESHTKKNNQHELPT